MRRAALYAVPVMAAVLVASCGGFVSERISSPPVTLPGRVNNEGTLDVTTGDHVTITLHDFAFKPTFLRAAPGESLSIELDNTTSHTHTFTVSNLPGGPDVVVAPHSKGHADLEVPLTGTVAFSCRFHEGRGMQGAIYTKPGAPVNGAPGGVVSTTAPTPFPSGWGP